ncbi:MAG: DUF4293 domain-containing protein [Rikenellaceae bacterium]
MIQRVQTIYLILAVVAAALTLFMPLAFFSISTGELFDLYASGLHSSADGEMLQNSIFMFVLGVIITVVPLVTIFLFKNRMLQIRACVIEVVLLFGFYIMLGTYYYLCCRVFGQIGVELKGVHVAIAAPLVAMLMTFLAAKSIFSDELLVRSTDRIR